MEIREVGITRILNPTSIDLGDFVINPYKGCQYACLYCYAQFSTVAQKDKRPWGSYVDVRLNGPLILEKELFIKKPKKLLLGSTTECFQPLEKKYRLTARIIETLNKNKIPFSILTRSPLIAEYVDLLNKGYCSAIYFTVNTYADKLKKLLEPLSPAFALRTAAIAVLQKNKLPVIPYLSPFLPFISDSGLAFEAFKDSPEIDFEGLNFNLGNIGKVIHSIGLVYPDIAVTYEKMRYDAAYYNTTWRSIENTIRTHAKTSQKRYTLFIHGLKDYFKNTYAQERTKTLPQR